MKEIIADKNLVAKCGLYCGACGAYLKGKCPGCAGNEKAAWCGIRSCCGGNNRASCADCKDFADVNDCRKFNNIFSKIFKVLFGSNRAACIALIREKGYDSFSRHMAEHKLQTLKRNP